MIFKRLLKTKKSKKDLKDMSKKEKIEFLSMDLIERMIRVEQRVASSFGEHILYNKTEYYKNLDVSEKRKFNRYLKRKGTRKFFIWTFLFLILLSPVFLKVGLSGQVISENLENTFSILNKGLFLSGLVFIVILFILFISNKAKERKFEKHFEIIDDIALKNYLVK